MRTLETLQGPRWGQLQLSHLNSPRTLIHCDHLRSQLRLEHRIQRFHESFITNRYSSCYARDVYAGGGRKEGVDDRGDERRVHVPRDPQGSNTVSSFGILFLVNLTGRGLQKLLLSVFFPVTNGVSKVNLRWRSIVRIGEGKQFGVLCLYLS